MADVYEFVRHVPIAPGWPLVGTDVIAAEFHLITDRAVLDANDEGTDELYVRIYMADCLPHSGPEGEDEIVLIHRYDTNQIEYDF